MIYKATSPNLNALIDKYRTGNYGEDDSTSYMTCNHCGRQITHGSLCFMLDSDVYCMRCRDVAEAHILREVCDNYIYEF